MINERWFVRRDDRSCVWIAARGSGIGTLEVSSGAPPIQGRVVKEDSRTV